MNYISLGLERPASVFLLLGLGLGGPAPPPVITGRGGAYPYEEYPRRHRKAKDSIAQEMPPDQFAAQLVAQRERQQLDDEDGMHALFFMMSQD